MAVRISPGSGATVATEILGGANYQQIKVVDGSISSSTPWIINSDGSGLFSTNNLMSLASGTVILASQNGTWNTGLTGLISLASGTNIQATQSGQWDIRSALSLASIYGNVGIVGTPTVNVNGLISLASGTSVLTSFSGLISLASGTQVITSTNNLTSLASGTNIIANQGGNWDIRSALSLASIYGKVSTVGTVTVDGSGVTQPISGSVGITGLVSLASGTSVLTSFSGLISLASGTEVRSLATILNFPATQAVSFNQLVSLASGTNVLANFGGVISLASGQLIQVGDNGGSLTVDGSVGLTGLVSLASGTNVLANFGGVISLASGQLIQVGNNGNTFDVRSLLSLASIYGNVGITGTPTVNVNGLISLASGTSVLTAFSGVISLASGTNILATQSGVWNTGITGVISLASGTNILANFGGVISLASGQSIGMDRTPILGAGNTQAGFTSTASGNPQLMGLVFPSGRHFQDSGGNLLVNVQNFAIGAFGNVDTNTANTTSGLVDSNLLLYDQVSNTWQRGRTVSASTASGVGIQAAGMIGFDGTNFQKVKTDTSGNILIGGLISLASGTNILTTQSGSWGVGASLATTQVLGSLNSLASIYGLVSLTAGSYVGASLATTTVIGSLNSLASIYGLVGNAAGANYIGLASVVPAFTPVSANYTSFATLIIASGAASLFAPPNNQRWILKDLIIGSSGQNVVNIQSGGSIVMIPYMSLATMGGFISNFGESGMRADALNSAFVINTKSTATLSIFANVRFDAT